MTERFSRVFFRSLALGLLTASVLLPAPDARACGPYCDMMGGDSATHYIDGAVGCESLCDRTNGCLGWTWVKPGVQGPQAVCWLKNRLMPATQSNCCISGFRGDRTAAASVRQFQYTPLEKPAPPPPAGQGKRDPRTFCECRDESGRPYAPVLGMPCGQGYAVVSRNYDCRP